MQRSKMLRGREVVISVATGRSSVNEAPEVMRRRLRVALRHDREEAGLTQREAAEALDWHVSKINRIEQGSVGITPVDLRALLAVYKTADDERIAELVELARGSRKQSWRQYKDVYSHESLTLFAHESAAKTIYKYEPTFVPGLLQTEEYARALLAGLGHNDGEIEPMVAARLERQELLDRDVPPQLQFILGEAVVSRAVGGPRVMVRQLERIKSVAVRPGMSLQILPFATGAHPKMGGAFTILEFADESLDDLLYLENAGGESVSRDEPDVLADYYNAFSTIQEKADEKHDLARFVDEIIATRFSTATSSRGSNGNSGTP